VERWRAEFERLERDRQDAGWSPFEIGVDAVAALAASGLTASELLNWFEHYQLRYTTPAALKKPLAFHRGGWTKEQVAVLEQVLTPDADRVYPPAPTGWAKVTFEQALACARAGLSAAEALRIVRSGEYDEQTLAMLAVLRGTSHLGDPDATDPRDNRALSLAH
jgi:hypothetical protein